MDILLTVLLSLTVVCTEGVSIITTNPDPLLEDQPGFVICSGGTPFSINKDGESIVTCGNGCGLDATSTYYQQIQFTVTSNTNSVTVNIPTISRQRDSGPWICTVFNSGSMESTTKNINITDIKVSGQSTIVTNPVNIIEGESATITCNKDDKVYLIYRIVNQVTRQITACVVTSSISCTSADSAYSVYSNNNSVTINIQTVSRQRDSGTWQCGNFTTIQVQTDIDVKAPVKSVSITTTGLVFQVGSLKSLTCLIMGTPYPSATVTWYIGSRSLGTTNPLLYEPLKSDNNQILNCSASNGYGGSKSDTHSLNITYSVSTVDIIDITSVALNYGDTTRVTCQADGNPVPTITWSIIKGRQLSTVTGQTTDIYQYTATKLDNGKYLQCSASNGIGVAQTDSVALNIRYLNPVNINTNKTEVEEGNKINITCSTQSNPVASITWHNGSEVIKTIHANEDVFIIEKASCLDTNDYYCTVTNDAYPDKLTDVVSLFIRCSPRQDSRVTPIRTVTGNITEIVNLVADVISYPPPSFTWYYIEDNMVIYISNKNPFKQIDKTISTNTYKSTLTINITSKLLYKTYRVNVSNDDGSFIIFNYSVVSQSRPDPPHQLKIQSQSNNQICVEWKPGFNGGATQTFIVQHSTDDITWVDSSPIPDRNDGQLIQYCITDLEPETQYYIRLTAKNTFGESQVAYFMNYCKIVKTTGKKVTSDESEIYSKGRASGLTSGMSSGIGIGIGISVGVALLGLAAFFIYRRLLVGKQKKTNVNENYSTLNPGTQSGEPQTYQELSDVRTYEVVGPDNTRSAENTYINT